MLRRNLKTQESRDFWDGVERTAARVDQWPAWMKGSSVREVIIYSDGACKGNPGPGGWGHVMMSGDERVEGSGGELKTTNNRMEMMGALVALARLKEPCKVTLYTDSRYLCDCFRKKWYVNWKKNGWKTTRGTEVSNQDLWEKLLEQNAKHDVEWRWVKGHSDNEHNNRCDELAVEARKKVEKDGRSKSR